MITRRRNPWDLIPMINFDDEVKGGELKMETKSRYQVISELEQQKRQLIVERDNLNDRLNEKEKKIKEKEREKEDDVRQYDRQIADLKDELDNFKKTLAERKETIKELIKSVDESLARFEKLESKKSSS